MTVGQEWHEWDKFDEIVHFRQWFNLFILRWPVVLMSAYSVARLVSYTTADVMMEICSTSARLE